MISITIETTVLKVSYIKIVENQPTIETKELSFAGKSEKEISKLIGNGTIISRETAIKTYEMSLEKFIENSIIK